MVVHNGFYFLFSESLNHHLFISIVRKVAEGFARETLDPSLSWQVRRNNTAQPVAVT